MGIVSAVYLAAGAAIGGMARYGLSKKIPIFYGTLVANTLACFVLSWVATNHPSVNVAIFLGTGCAGALSTWSTLAKEIGSLMEGSKRVAFVYLIATVLLGLCSAWLGANIG